MTVFTKEKIADYEDRAERIIMDSLVCHNSRGECNLLQMLERHERQSKWVEKTPMVDHGPADTPRKSGLFSDVPGSDCRIKEYTSFYDMVADENDPPSPFDLV